MSELPTRIRKARLSAQMAQAELALSVRIKRSAVTQREHPRGALTSIDHLKRIALEVGTGMHRHRMAGHRGGTWRIDDDAPRTFAPRRLRRRYSGRDRPPDAPDQPDEVQTPDPAERPLSPHGSLWRGGIAAARVVSAGVRSVATGDIRGRCQITLTHDASARGDRINYSWGYATL